MNGLNVFFKELLVGCAIAGVIGIGAGVAACSCVERVFDNMVDASPDAHVVLDGEAPDMGVQQD